MSIINTTVLNSDPELHSKFLTAGTLLDDFVIEKPIASGGFSYVYLARDVMGVSQHAIKEYLPKKIAFRNDKNIIQPLNDSLKSLYLKGRALFFEEARVLASFDHSNIVKVQTFFEQNGTVYLVMNFEVGETLENFVVQSPDKITESFLVHVFCGLLDGVNQIHQNNMLHLDIKPSNILIRHNNEPLLIDFGSIQENTIHNKKRSTVFTKGFSPAEQYLHENKLGTWSDVYAIGASIRSCLEGYAPIASIDRQAGKKLVPAVKKFKKKYPKFLLQAIDDSMEINYRDRIQTVTEFKKILRNN